LVNHSAAISISVLKGGTGVLPKNQAAN